MSPAVRPPIHPLVRRSKSQHWLRPVAMLSVGAVALAGLVVVQAWQSGERARAAEGQNVPVIGRVFNDLYAGGLDVTSEGGPNVLDPQAPGVPNTGVELWQESGQDDGEATLLDTVITDADGRYRFTLPEYPASYLVRVRPTQIDGVNAMQTSFWSLTEGDSEVSGFCWNRYFGDYFQWSEAEFECAGARRDGIDPPEVTTPLGPIVEDEWGDQSQTGNANTLARIEAESSDLVELNFSLTASASWGDLPDEYGTTQAAGGPYAQGALRWYYNPYHDAALQLGWLSVLSGDGIPRADAKSHRYADDGIEFALKEWRHESRADGSTDTVEVPDNELTWYPAQDAVFTNNTDYRVRATINAHCDFLPKATVKLWASTIDRNTGEASGRLTARPIWQAAPAFHCSASEKATRQSVERVVYGDLNLSHIDGWQDVDPDGGFTDLYLRARIGIDSGFTAYSPGEPNDPYTEPWVMPGEIEDYRAHLAKTVAYVRNILPNGIRAAIAYEYTGMREDLDFYLPFDGGVFSAPDQYGNLDPAVATVVGVGAPGADSTNGWHVSGAGYHDYGALYCWHHGGDGGGALVDGDSITFGGYSPTVVCDAYYGAPLDPALSNMTISPAPDQALPVQDATRGSYSIKIRGRGTVPDIGGGTVEAPAVGAELTVVVEPVGGNASDYLLCLARDSYWQDCATSHEVYLDQDGQAELWLRAWDAGTYRVTAYLAGSDGPVFSSQDVYFAGHTSADDVAGGEFTIDTSTPKYADYGLLPGAVGFDGTWDYYTAQLVAWDNQGQGVMGLEGPGGVIANGCGSAVAVTPVDGQPGHYEARIYSNSAAEALCLLAAGGVMFTDSATGATSQTLTWLPLTVADPSKSSVRVEQRGEVPIAGWVDEGNPGDAEWLRVELRDANWSLLDGHSGDADELWRWSENNPSALHYARATDAYCANQSYCRVFVYSSSPGHFVPRVVINPDTAEEATLTADRPVFFGFSEPDPGSSSAVASRTPGQQANLASRPAGAAGKQTVTVRLRDAQGFTAFGADWFDWGVKIELAATGAEYGDGADPFGGEGLDWGEFECVGVTDLAYGALWDYCPTGVYTVDVYSSWAGDRKVAVTVSGSWDEPGGQPGYEFVLANGENRATSVLSLPFVPPTEPSAADSRLQVSPANLAGEVLTVGRGESYTAAVTVMDAGGYNPIHDAYVYLWLEQEDSGDGEECLAAFPNGREGRVLRTSLTGKAQVTIKSADVTKCVLRAQLETEFGYDELPNSPQTLEWVDHSAPVFSPARSYYTVSSDAIYADGEDAGTVTLQLMGTDGQPWNGSSSIMGFGPTDSGLAVSWFTHTSSPGEFTAPVTGTEVGTYPVTVSVNDAVLTASGNGSAAFVAGPAAFGPDLTRWTSPEWRSIEADGVAEALLEVAVTDARGRPMAGETVEFDVLDERVRVGLSTGPGTFESRTGADGVARLTVKSSAREYFSTEVVAFVGADQVPGSTVIEFTNFDGPARLWADVIVSPSDPADSTEGVPTPVAPGESYQVGVTPFDGSENVRIGNLPVEFSLSGPDCTGTFVGADGDGKALATVTAEVGPDAGTALAEVTSATPGACVLTVAVTTVDDVRGSGRTLVWTPSLPTLDLAASQFTVSQTPVVVGGSDSGTVTATLVGTDGQPWAEAVTLAGSGPVGSGVTVGAFVPVDAVGVYTAQFSGTTAGDWAISLTANGDALSAASGPDGIAHLIDDPAPPGGTTATVVIEPSDEAGVPVPLKAGNDYRATVTVVDEDGAPVAKTPVTFAVSSGSDCILNSALQKSYTVSTSDAGQAVVTVGTYPRRATTCPLTVTVPAADRVVGSGKVLVFTAPGTLDLAKSWFTVGERTAYADGSAIVPLTVQLIDEDGDRWIGSGTYNPNLQVTTPDCPEAWAAQPVHSAEHGEYGSYVRSTEVGECAVRVYVDADYQYGLLTPQGNGVAKFVAGPVAIGADLTRVAAPEPVSVDDAAGSVLVAHVTDARGRPMSGVDVLFSLPSGLSAGSTSGLATVPVTSDADGVASLTVSAAVAGTYPVAVSVGGVTVYGSSASVEFTEAPEPGLVTATVTVTPSDEAGNPLPVSTEGNSNQYQVRVDVLDSDGAPVNGARVDFALTPTDCVGRLEHGTGDLKTSWRTTGDYGRAGFVTESIGSGSAGSCALTVSVAAADQVVGSPVTLTWFDPAGPSAADSTWALSPSSGEVWVSQEVQLAVTARDGTSAHAPVSGALVEVTLPEGLWFSRGVGDPSVPVYSGTSGSDGLVLAWVKSLAPGAYPVEVRVDGVLLDPAPVLTFKEVFLDPAASTFNVTSAPVVADGVASGAVHVELRADQLSYWPLEFDPTRLSAFGGEGSGLVVSGFVDDGRGLGLLSATFTGTEVGDWPVTVLLDGEPLSPNVSGWEVAHMVLGDPAFGPGLTRLVPPDGTAVADGSSALAVSAVVVDSLGRALAGEEVRFVLPDGLSSGGSAGGGAHPAATGPDGVASLEVTAEEPGVYQVTAVVRRSGSDTPIVNGSPLLVEFTEVPAAPTFTVSFDSLGGPDVAPVVVERGQPVAELPSVSRDGFRFEGWFDQAGGGVEAVAPFTPSADVTLFAHWAALPAFGQGLTRLVAPQDVGIAGESGVTVRAVVVDRDGSPLAGETVSFYVPEGLSAGAVAGPAVVQATTGEDGVAELVVAAGAAGSYGVTADVLVGGVLAPVVNGSPAAVVFVAPPDAGVTLTAVARCAAGKNQLAVTAFNGSAEALDVEFVSDWGSKQFANVQPGKNAFHAFTVRSTDVAAGQVQVTIRTTAPTPVTVTREVDYPDNHC